MKRAVWSMLLLLPLCGLVLAQDTKQELNDKSYERIRDYVLPNADEEAWLKVNWRATFWDAVIDAQKEDKPIMLFAMNGHPFACT